MNIGIEARPDRVDAIGIRKLHEAYIGIIVAMLLVWLVTYKFGADSRLTEYLSFALTLSSLLLSAVAIALTILANTDLSRNFVQLRTVGDDAKASSTRIEQASQDIRNSSSTLATSVSDLAGLVSGLTTQVATTNLRIQAIVETQQQPRPALIHSGGQVDFKRFLDYTSMSGLMAMYLIKAMSDETKILRIDELQRRIPELVADYTLGYVMASNSAGIVGAAQVSGFAPDRLITITSDPPVAIEEITRRVQALIAQQGATRAFFEALWGKIEAYHRER
jgi:hypothetical protein